MPISRAWCPCCKKWVPSYKFHWGADETGEHWAICQWCIDGTSGENNFVYDPEYDLRRCVFCDSANTEIVEGLYATYKCRDCGEQFQYDPLERIPVKEY